MANVGFIGLGIMGSPMAGHLIKGGHRVFLHSRRGVPPALTDAGGIACSNSGDVAQKADVVLYAISTNISHIESDGDKVLKYFASETGGRSFFPFKVEDMQQDFVDIYNELRHQYNISYRPDPLKTDGLFHNIDVRVKARKDLVVHVRKGYYAPKM